MIHEHKKLWVFAYLSESTEFTVLRADNNFITHERKKNKTHLLHFIIPTSSGVSHKLS